MSTNRAVMRWILLFAWFQLSTSRESVLISESSHFAPCSFNSDTLLCDGKTMEKKPNLQFAPPSQMNITRLEIVNLPLEEIPAEFIRPLTEHLLSVKIHSTMKIKSIDRKAFSGFRSGKVLEIKSLSTRDKSPIHLTEAFRDLTALTDLKLINLNIMELRLDFLKQLTSLTMENCDLNPILSETFGKNRHLSVLSIKGLKNSTGLIDQFRNWPKDSGPAIKSLNLENCNLRTFPQFSNNIAANLTHLSLSKNPIERIDIDDTVHLKTLQSLILSYTKLNHKTMTGLKLLKTLKLIVLNNVVTLKDLPSEIEQMDSLKSIFIEMSQIERLSITLPPSIEKVVIAYLRGSVAISSSFLSKCNKLKVLYLNSLHTKDMRYLSDNVHVYKHSLQDLSLNDNALLEAELWNVIRSLTNLERLYLNKADIRSIPDDVLDNLANLKKLSLSHNYLTYDSINTAGFQKVAQHLTEIDFSFNQLEHLPPCLFYSLPNTTKVNVLSNAIICDCNLLWLHEGIRSGSMDFPRLNFTCKNTGKSLYQLDEQDLKTCSSEVDRCLPLKTGNYKIAFSLHYEPARSKVMIKNLNATNLGFLFDYMRVNVIQKNESYHPEIDKYEMNQSSIQISQELQTNSMTVCLTLVRNSEEYEFPYNCQSLSVKLVDPATSWMSWVGIGVGTALTVTAIIVIIIIVVIRRLVKEKHKQSEEVYSNYHSAYSMPSDTYQRHDQYTEILDSEDYYRALTESVMETAFPINDRLPQSYPSTQHLSRMTMPSKSVDEGLNMNGLSQKSKTKGLSKNSEGQRPAEFSSLNSLNIFETPFPTRQHNSGRASLPNTCVHRTLTALPEINIKESGGGTDWLPPKPKFPTSDIKNLLSNADNHLSYYLHYGSNAFLETDISEYSPYKVDSGLGVSRLSTHSQVRSSPNNSVVI